MNGARSIYTPAYNAIVFYVQNGAGCKYKHALPPGYTFMTKKEKEIDAAMKGEEWQSHQYV